MLVTEMVLLSRQTSFAVGLAADSNVNSNAMSPTIRQQRRRRCHVSLLLYGPTDFASHGNQKKRNSKPQTVKSQKWTDVYLGTFLIIKNVPKLFRCIFEKKSYI